MVYEARQPYPDVAVYLTENTAHRALRGIHNAQIMLNGGFATLRDPGARWSRNARSGVRPAVVVAPETVSQNRKQSVISLT